MTFCQKHQWVLSMYAGYFVKKSPYIPHYNKFILATMGNGMNIKWKRDVFNSMFRKEKHKTPKKLMVLSVENLQGCFIILAGGIWISLSVALGEVLFKKIRRIKKEEKI